MLEMVMVPVTSLQSILSFYWVTLSGAFGVVPAVLLSAVAVVGTVWVLRFVIKAGWSLFKSWKDKRKDAKIKECNDLKIESVLAS